MNEQPGGAIDDDDANRAASATPPAKPTRRKRPAGSLEARRRFEQERAVAVAKSRLNERRRRLRTIFDSGGDLPAAAIAVALTVIRQTREATGEVQPGVTSGRYSAIEPHPPSKRSCSSSPHSDSSNTRHGHDHSDSHRPATSGSRQKELKPANDMPSA